MVLEIVDNGRGFDPRQVERRLVPGVAGKRLKLTPGTVLTFQHHPHQTRRPGPHAGRIAGRRHGLVKKGD